MPEQLQEVMMNEGMTMVVLCNCIGTNKNAISMQLRFCFIAITLLEYNCKTITSTYFTITTKIKLSEMQLQHKYSAVTIQLRRTATRLPTGV